MIEKLGENGIKALIFIARKQERGENPKITDFREILSLGSSSMYNAFAILDKHQLIQEEKYGVVRRFKLTEKGQKIADLLLQADKIVL